MFSSVGKEHPQTSTAPVRDDLSRGAALRRNTARWRWARHRQRSKLVKTHRSRRGRGWTGTGHEAFNELLGKKKHKRSMVALIQPTGSFTTQEHLNVD